MAGGAGIYISSSLNALPRSDLNLILMVRQNPAGLKSYMNTNLA